jgi:dihydroorotate dehydrogenase electron transfer subunit
MSDAAGCACTAAQPLLEDCVVVENRRLAGSIHSLVLKAPGVARAVAPGQFVHLRLPALEAHILRRPFSVFCADATTGTVRIDYQVVGTGSAHMAGLEPGARPDVIGPLGKGWQLPTAAAHPLLITGGIGSAPLYMLARQLAGATGGAAGAVRVIMGAQTASMLVHKDDYAGILEPGSLKISTDDGSAGAKGFTTDALQTLLQSGEPVDFIATCGPEPMLRIVAAIAAQHGIACQVSLERRMACGVGACLSCVVATNGGQKRACVDGPVFDAREVVW